MFANLMKWMFCVTFSEIMVDSVDVLEGVRGVCLGGGGREVMAEGFSITTHTKILREFIFKFTVMVSKCSGATAKKRQVPCRGR